MESWKSVIEEYTFHLYSVHLYASAFFLRFEARRLPFPTPSYTTNKFSTSLRSNMFTSFATLGINKSI